MDIYLRSVIAHYRVNFGDFNNKPLHLGQRKKDVLIISHSLRYILSKILFGVSIQLYYTVEPQLTGF